MQIRFASPLPWWVVIAIAVIGGVAICLWYWREVRQIRSRWSVLLAVLRGTAFFLLFVMLLRPSIEYTWTQGDLSRLRILMDTSSSMQTRDEPSLQNPNESVSRIERVKQSLVHETNGQLSLLARLARQHHIDVVNLEGQVIWDSQQTTMLDSNWEIAADRARTPLGEALLAQIREGLATEIAAQTNQAGGELSGAPKITSSKFDALVLISDGQSNGAIEPIDLLSQNSESNLPIYTAAAGKEFEPIDLGILSSSLSTKVRKEDFLRGTVRIKERCPEGTSYKLLFKNGGVVVYEQRLTVGNQGIRDVSFEFAALESFDLAESRLDRTDESRRAIPIDLECEIVPIVDLAELTLTNNVRMLSTWGITRENRILILDPRGRWETRYIRNALERDPNWELVGRLGISEFEKSSAIESKEALGSFDLVILTSDAAKTLGTEQSQWLSDFVSKTGGGMIWIDSVRSDRELNEPWKTLLPFQWESQSEAVYSQPNLARQGGLRLMGSAIEEPALKLAPEDSAGSIWDRLAGPRSALVQKAKPGCEVLVEFKGFRGKPGRGQSEEDWFPLILTSRFGQGRILSLASDETWRWRYEVADLYHQRFWNQISVWCMRPPFAVSDEYLSVDAGSRVYTVDEAVTIRAKLLNEDRLPIENGNVKAVFSQSGTELARLEMTEQIDSGGVYQGAFRDLESLTKSMAFDPTKEVMVHIEATGVPWEAIKTKTSFRIDQTVDLESSQLACDTERLASIAQKTKAESLTLQSLDELENLLSVHTRGSINKGRLSLAESYIWLGLIMTVLALEWILRKRFGLV